MNPWGTTWNDDTGRPHETEKEAYLAHYSSAHGQYTDQDGRVYTSAREMAEARWDREHRGW